MNVRQGMKRLALFVGVLGAIAGGIVTFVFLSDVLEQRARHQAFERLANSQVVQEERKRRFVKASNTDVIFDEDTAQPISGLPQLPPGAVLTPKPQHDSEFAPSGWDAQGNPIYPATQHTSEFASAPSEVNRGGIKDIQWTKDLGVESIDTENGQTLYPEPAPAFWSYLLPLFFPVLGFFVPWSLVSAVVWVGAGFANKRNP